MKRLLTLTFSLLTAGITSLYAQDIITKQDGEEIEAKILRVSPTELVYKKWSNLDGPDFILPKSDIFMVKYQNGEKEVFKNKPTVDVKEENTNKENDKVVNAPVRNNSVFGEAGGIGYFISFNYERMFHRSQDLFLAWRTGFSPMGPIGTFSTALSINVGSKTDLFEAGIGGGYFYGIDNRNDDETNYLYFTPTIGYRRMSKNGFLFKSYISMLTTKEVEYTYMPQPYYNNNNYYYNNYTTVTNVETRYYPFVGFSFGYSF